MKINTNIILVSVLIILAIVALVILLNFKRITSATNQKISSGGSDFFPLQYGSGMGSEGPLSAVRDLQSYLNAQMDANDKANNIRYITAPARLIEDGMFGDKTLAAVKSLFGRNDVPRDIYDNVIGGYFNQMQLT